MSIHDWVTFEGEGRLDAHKETPESPNEGLISRANSPAGGIGIRLRDTIDMVGSLDVWVSVDHQGDYVGVQTSKDTMRLGEPLVDPYVPELEISGDILNFETITANRGVVEFHQIVFASTAPKWLMKGGNESEISTMLVSDPHSDAPNDIKLEDWALLNLRANVTFTGKLTFEKNCTVRVEAGKKATFDG